MYDCITIVNLSSTMVDVKFVTLTRGKGRSAATTTGGFRGGFIRSATCTRASFSVEQSCDECEPLVGNNLSTIATEATAKSAQAIFINIRLLVHDAMPHLWEGVAVIKPQ